MDPAVGQLEQLVAAQVRLGADARDMRRVGAVGASRHDVGVEEGAHSPRPA